jgi:hypothetical protein
MVFLRNICINALHKGAKNDDDDNEVLRVVFVISMQVTEYVLTLTRFGAKALCLQLD